MSENKIKKKRLDVLVFERGLTESREKAKILIMEGKVFVRGQREDKPGTSFPEDVEIELKGEKMPFVSRGGYKLDKALKVFPIDLSGAVCMDIGASTGGFTDCMLQNGASKVFSVDVGYGQFAWSLRTDKRVILMEKTNVRYLTLEDIGEKLDFISCDVSFISLSKIFPVIKALLKDSGSSVCLIKPQFEAGKDRVGKKGVVRDKAVHFDVINEVISYAKSFSLFPEALSFSPIKGPEGNIEYLLYLKASDCKDSEIEKALQERNENSENNLISFSLKNAKHIESVIEKTVEEAHNALDK